MNRHDLRRLAGIRLREAKALLRAECYNGAYYLCGYVVECALKACIAKATRRSEFPDLERVKGSYTHNLANLVRLAGLEASRLSEAAGDAAFGVNWGSSRTGRRRPGTRNTTSRRPATCTARSQTVRTGYCDGSDATGRP